MESWWFSAFCPRRNGFIYHILSMGLDNDLFLKILGFYLYTPGWLYTHTSFWEVSLALHSALGARLTFKNEAAGHVSKTQLFQSGRRGKQKDRCYDKKAPQEVSRLDRSYFDRFREHHELRAPHSPRHPDCSAAWRQQMCGLQQTPPR